MSWENYKVREWERYGGYEVHMGPGKGDFRRVGAGGPGYRFYDLTYERKPENRIGYFADCDAPFHTCVQALSAEDAVDFWIGHLEHAWGCTVTILDVKEVS